ncbi:hypothetical protein G9A89_008611 [Geosiphon pyriformis]|nr:hypothetical protein G9A89_008611 [Geosiphon pyriformis]
MDARDGLTSYFAASAFVDDTIWVGNCLSATQKILDIASEFFSVNDISINDSKMVAIPINQEVKDASLSISGSNILIVKRKESHRYLKIFILSDGLSKLSLAKAHSDVRFFSNVVLRKTITEKQFLYLVSAVLQPIVSYRLQFSCVLKNVCDSNALHHLELFGLRIFEQVLTENLLASLISFANAGGILGRLFDHRAMNLQATSWMPRHPLQFLIRLMIDLIDCFLSGVTCALVLCNLSLDGDMFDVFWAGGSVTVLDVLGSDSYLLFVNQILDRNDSCFSWNTFRQWKRLDPKDLVPAWFTTLVNFVSAGGLSGGEFVSSCSTLAGVSCDFSYIHNQLLASGLDPVTIYMDGSVKCMGSVGAHRGVAAYFSRVDVSIGVSVNGLLSSTLVELQVITLALECVPGFSSVVLFTDSQALLDMCCSRSGGFGPDFRDKCWIEKEYISQIISRKVLLVTWNKIKGHSGDVGNKHANFYTNFAVTSSFILTPMVPFHFFKVEGRPVSKNAHRFVKALFNAVNFVGWKARCVGVFMDAISYDGFDRARTFSVWHSDGKISSGFTSLTLASLCSYFMKVLHHRLPVAAKKRLYNSKYLSVACIRCGLLEDSDHTFSCLSNNNARKELLSTAALDWADLLGVCADDSVVFCSLGMVAVSVELYTALAKGFVLKSWINDMCCWLGADFDGGALVVRFVQHFIENHHSSIWLPAAKLRVYYKKHNLLSRDGFSIPSVSDLSSLWSSDVIRSFATIGPNTAIMKKTAKNSSSDNGFETVLLRKKRREGVLEDSFNGKKVAFKVQKSCSWSSETGDTTESESIDMEEECLVEETSFDFGEGGVLAGGDHDQTLMSSKVKTKKALGKLLGKIDFSKNSDGHSILSDAPLELLLSLKNLVNVSIRKLFALDIGLNKVASNSSQEKLVMVRKLFSGINGFGGASTFSKFSGIIRATFTSKSSLMKATNKAASVKILVNTNLKKSSGQSDWAVIIKEIPIRTSAKTVHAALSEFGVIKTIKIQLIGLWQKAVVEFEQPDQADLVAAKWSILIGKDAVCVARADSDKEAWDTRD